MFFRKKRTEPQGTPAVFSVTGLHCTSCGMTIDGALEETPGVITSRTSYAASTTEILYDPARVTLSVLQQVIEQAGYQARMTDRPAHEE